MYCKTFHCTLPVTDCLKRQDLIKEKLNNGLIDSGSKKYELLFCLDCELGLKVRNNPRKQIDRDVHRIAKDHMERVKKRGWLHKSPIRNFENTTDENPTVEIIRLIDADMKRERTMKNHVKRLKNRPK